MSSTSANMLEVTLRALEGGLRVRHIAVFQVRCCRVDDDVASVLNNPDLAGFDQIPVKDGEHIIGVLDRAMASGSAMRDCMQRLDESKLASADMPLTEFIHIAATSPYRLVVDGDWISGIVTRSDLLKLPVRPLVFTLVTHLELVMAKVIEHRAASDDEWSTFTIEVACRRSPTPHRSGRLPQPVGLPALPLAID